MQYLNVRKGITKILISEIIQIVASLFVIAALLLSGTVLENLAEGAFGIYAIVMIVSVLGLAALVLYLAGVIQARREEHEFHMALIFTIIALGLQIAVTIFETQSPDVAKWIEFGGEIAELFAFESVVSGIVDIAKKQQNEKIASIGKKMRVIITIVWVAIILDKIFEFISTDISSTFRLVFDIAETIDHVFYLILLIQGIRMLMRTGAQKSLQDDVS